MMLLTFVLILELHYFVGVTLIHLISFYELIPSPHATVVYLR